MTRRPPISTLFFFLLLRRRPRSKLFPYTTLFRSVGFYLLNLGFVTLTLRATGDISSPRQAVQLLSVKIGEMLLVIGALHFANLAIFTRLRRRAVQPPRPAGPT